MASVYARGNVLWFRVKVAGEWERVASPFKVGQEREAKRAADRYQERSDAGTTAEAGRPITVARAVEPWLGGRRETFEASRKRYEATGDGLVVHRDHATDERRIRKHFLPHLGAMEVAAVRPRHLAEWIHKLRTAMDPPLAPQTVHNIYAVAKAFFRAQAVAGHVEHNPAILTSAQLGDVGKQTNAGRYTREQFELMIGSPALTEHERIFAALGGFLGLRCGGIAGLRWGDLDTTTAPLWRIVSARTYVKQPTKTNQPSVIPVHPILREMLTAWRVTWTAEFGHAPTADDPIVFREPTIKQATRGAVHTAQTAGKVMDRILATLAIQPARMKLHALRGTFISIALEDGASAELIKRITHAGNTGDAFNRYDKADYFPQVCAAIALMRITPRSQGPRTARSTAHSTAPKIANDNGRLQGGGRGGGSGKQRARDRTKAVTMRDGSVAMLSRNARRAHAVLSRSTAPETVAIALARAVLGGAARDARTLARALLAGTVRPLLRG